MILPGFIKEFLSKNGYIFIEKIQENKRKKTYVFKIKKNNKLFVLKAFDKSSPYEVKKKFEAERIFYNTNENNLIPKLEVFSSNILVIEYVNSVTLRESLIKKNVDTNLINSLFASVEKLYFDFNRKITHNHSPIYCNAFDKLRILVFSGPIQTINHKVTFFKKCFNFLYYFYLKKQLKKILDNVNKKELLIGLVHGDLHYNNILITQDSIKFIDFENIRYDGYFIFDVIFLCAIIEALIDKGDIYKHFSNRIDKLLFQNKDLLNVYSIYKKAVKYNWKFYSKKL